MKGTENNTTIEAAIKELHKADVKVGKIAWKIEGEINPEFRAASNELVELKISFKEKYGEQCLTTFVIYKTLKTRLANVPACLNRSTFKLKNSKGSNFGD